ncbi:MAG: LysR family transcriptional regulator [Gammaproteobacteria bacterium]
MKTPKISLEQWASFKAVVDEGSFAMAAEALNKSQSSISYAIARLNEQLPRPVLSIAGRKAELTEDGKVLYRRASQLLAQASETEDVARQLAQGLEAEVIIAVDVLVGISKIIPALEQLSLQFPLTRVRLLETSLSGTDEALLEKKAHIVIGANVPVGFSGIPVYRVRMIPVAHPSHALFNTVRQRPVALASDPSATDEGISDWELKTHRQIVLRDTGQKRVQDAGWLGSEQRWTVSHFSSSLSILRAGLGFAFLPEDWAQEDLEAGTLQTLPLTRGKQRIVQLYLMLSSQESAGPATRLLAANLEACLAQKNYRA